MGFTRPGRSQQPAIVEKRTIANLTANASRHRRRARAIEFRIVDFEQRERLGWADDRTSAKVRFAHPPAKRGRIDGCRNLAHPSHRLSAERDTERSDQRRSEPLIGDSQTHASRRKVVFDGEVWPHRCPQLFRNRLRLVDRRLRLNGGFTRLQDRGDARAGARQEGQRRDDEFRPERSPGGRLTG
jgi:hypothetical protein